MSPAEFADFLGECMERLKNNLFSVPNLLSWLVKAWESGERVEHSLLHYCFLDVLVCVHNKVTLKSRQWIITGRVCLSNAFVR